MLLVSVQSIKDMVYLKGLYSLYNLISSGKLQVIFLSVKYRIIDLLPKK